MTKRRPSKKTLRSWPENHGSEGKTGGDWPVSTPPAEPTTARVGIGPNTSQSQGIQRFAISWKRMAAACGVLIALAVLSYSPVFRAEFLPFDDQEYVFLNPYVADGFSYQSTVWAFTKVSVSNWHPLTWLSHTLDAELFDLNPHGHHAMSVVWHVANACLLFLVMSYATGQAVPSFCLALLFAVHPTHLEAVGWVAQRKTLISTLLMLLTIAAYTSYVRKNSWRWYMVSLSLFAGSLMAKQTFVTMPLLLVLLDFWPLRRGVHESAVSTSKYWTDLLIAMIRQLPDKLPFAALGFVAALITMLAQTDAMQSLDSFPVTDRLGNVCIAYCRYLAHLFWPSLLSIYYTIHLETITLPAVIGAAVTIMALSLLSLWASRRYPYLLTGWFWFLVSMLPVIGIVHVGSQSMADRYLYNASFGILLAVIWFCWDVYTLVQRSANSDERRMLLRAVVTTVFVAVTAFLTLNTFRRSQSWQTVLGTFHEAIEHDPTNWLAHRVLAEKYIELRDLDKAVHHAQAALKEYEDSGFYVLQAIARRELGQSREAIQLLERAIELNKDDALAYSLLAVVHSETGQLQPAQQMLDLAEQKIELPVNQVYRRIPSLTLRNCGIALLSSNQPLEAIKRFEKARQWDARDIGLVQELAQAEMKAGLNEPAIDRLEEIKLSHPDSSATFALLGQAYKQIGQAEKAEASLRRALEIEPGETTACLHLGDLFLRSGRPTEAENLINQALTELKSGRPSKDSVRLQAEMEAQLGDIVLAQQDLPGAIDHYQRALQFVPDHYMANNNLAWLLATEPNIQIRDPSRAVELAEHANSLPGAKEKGSLGTLAAAYAAVGRMEAAVEAAEEALKLAETKGDFASVTQLRAQLELHRQGKPLVESVLKPVKN